TGATGPQGTTGATGSTGPQGPQGAQGLTWQGFWNRLKSYVAGDAVTYLGSAYVATNTPQDPNCGPPFCPSDWSLLAAQGAEGPRGARGPRACSWRGFWSRLKSYVAGDAVTYLGSAYVATNTPQDPNCRSPYCPGDWGPQGAKGAAGPPGPPGPQGAQGLTW